MTDNMHLHQRLEGEPVPRSNPTRSVSAVTPQVVNLNETGINTIDQVSLEALINVLLQRGVCSETELLAEENRLRSRRETITSFHFTPVQIPNERYAHSSHGHHWLRRWAAKYHWSRRLGSLLFGWKWHRKKKI